MRTRCESAQRRPEGPDCVGAETPPDVAPAPLADAIRTAGDLGPLERLLVEGEGGD